MLESLDPPILSITSGQNRKFWSYTQSNQASAELIGEQPEGRILDTVLGPQKDLYLFKRMHSMSIYTMQNALANLIEVRCTLLVRSD